MLSLGTMSKVFSTTSPNEVFARAAQHNLEYVHFDLLSAGMPGFPSEIPDRIAQQIRDASQAQGVKLSSVSATYNVIHPDPAMREQGFQFLRAVLSQAQRMGAPYVALCSGTNHPSDMWAYHPQNASKESWLCLCHELERILSLAEQCDTPVLIEPETANVVSDAVRARELLDTMRSRHLKIILDAANLHSVQTFALRKRTLEQAVCLLHDDIALVHMKDRALTGGKLVYLPAGQGQLDFIHYIRLLEQIHFDGAAIIHGLTEAELPDAIAALSPQ